MRRLGPPSLVVVAGVLLHAGATELLTALPALLLFGALLRGHYPGERFVLALQARRTVPDAVRCAPATPARWPRAVVWRPPVAPMARHLACRPPPVATA